MLIKIWFCSRSDPTTAGVRDAKNKQCRTIRNIMGHHGTTRNTKKERQIAGSWKASTASINSPNSPCKDAANALETPATLTTGGELIGSQRFPEMPVRTLILLNCYNFVKLF